MKHRKRSDKTFAIPQGIAIGTLITIGAVFAGTAILAYLIVNGKLESQMIKYITPVILALSVYAGVFVSNKMIMKQYAIVGLILSAIVLAILIGIHIFFFEGQFKGVPGALAGISVGAACACLSYAAPKKGRRKMRNR